MRKKHGFDRPCFFCLMVLKRLFFYFILLCLPFSVSAETFEYASSAEWLALGHYQKTLGGYRATIGSPNFYLSPCGRSNPQKELEATIALFQSNDYETQCLFPARYLRLKAQGLIDAPFPKCAEYDQFKEDLRPAGVTLLFTDAYMNNSSSLFGHTLLRIDTARQGTQLLAHGVNYGAFTNGAENSFLYAIYGLAGFYPAGLTTKPYYDVINTYNNMENRDIWEYNLNLTDDELALFVAHIWEVGQTTTPYYFFSLNCSYMLMEVFDAVRPSLKLAEDFPFQTIPLDTVKAVVARPNLVRSVVYRPGRRQKILYRIDQMSSAQYQAFLDLVRSDSASVESLSEAEKADVYETAYQYIQYRYVAGDLELSEYRKKSFELLRARNREKTGQTFNDLTEGKNPVESHHSAEISIGGGVHNGRTIEQISLRPAYHSLNDRPYGFLRGAEINFLDQIWRYEPQTHKLYLQRLDILKLASLSPITRAFQAPSYRIDLSIDRDEHLRRHDDFGRILRASVGGGATLAFGQSLWGFVLTSAEGGYGGALVHNQWVGAGLSGGLLWQNDSFGFQAEIKRIQATSGDGTQTLLDLSGDYYMTRQLTLEVSFARKAKNLSTSEESLLRLKYRF